MGEKAKAARQLFFQRNSIALAKKMRYYPKICYNQSNKIDKNIKTLKKAIEKRNCKLINKTFITLFQNLKELTTKLNKEYLYCAVIQKRLIHNLRDIIKEIIDIGKIVDKSDITRKNLEKVFPTLDEEMHKFEDVIFVIENEIITQMRRARHLRQEHQTLKETNKITVTERKNLYALKDKAIDLKQKLKLEKYEEKEIKNIPHVLKQALKDKNATEAILRPLQELTKMITKESEAIAAEIKDIGVIQDLAVKSYFEVLDDVNNVTKYFNWLRNFNDPAPYPKEFIKEIEKNYEKLKEAIAEDEKFEYYVERFLLGKAKELDPKSIDLKNIM